jgi:glycosyltransferase involved in cell wall biosynthesis
MSVYNGEAHLVKTIDSILQQTIRDFEFVIVNDGSTDSSLQILRRYQQQDSRIKVIDQQNQGLTMALNAGCKAAKGKIIARQDVGDVSLPQRLEKQLAVLDADTRIVAVGVSCRRVGPGGEFLGYLIRDQSPEEVTQALLDHGTGLMHASSAFRNDAFLKIDGYRSEFRFAQDTDLWYRLSGLGLLSQLPDVLFEVLIETAGISGRQIEKQIKLANLAKACHDARRAGQSDANLLRQAAMISLPGEPAAPRIRRRQSANAAYFIGSLLLNQCDPRCRTYFLKSLRFPSPLPMAVAKYALSFAKCGIRDRTE